MGWEVRRNAEGGIETRHGIPNEQYSQFQADRQQCMAEFGYDDAAPLTADQAGSLYDKLAGSANCLRELGFEITDPPSREAFVEGTLNAASPPWLPYNELAEMAGSAAAFDEAAAKCPQPT